MSDITAPTDRDEGIRMADISEHLEVAGEQWRSYDEFAAGIDTYRLPSADLGGQRFEFELDGTEAHGAEPDGVARSSGPLVLEFQDASTVRWSSSPLGAPDPTDDPYDAVRVRPDVLFVNLELASRERESITVAISFATGRVIVAHSRIRDADEAAADGNPQVLQSFRAGVLRSTERGPAAAPTGEPPAASRDLIGKRNVYRYSPEHLYEHTYMSSERYMWQCLQGVQRGHGDVDLSTVWKLDHGLYLFCFREFKIAVASVWLHDLGYTLHTTGTFLGLTGDGRAEHARAGGHIYPLGAVSYPDVQPI